MKTVTGNQIDYLLNLLVKEEMANIDIEELSQQLRSAFAAERKKIAKDNWIKSVYGNIFLKIQGTKNIEELTNILVTELALATGSQLGSFYLHENQSLKSVAVYGLLDHKEAKVFRVGDGLVGQCALDLKAMHIKSLPEDYLYIESALGRGKPREIVLVPFTYQNELCGILELAKFGKYRPSHKKLLSQISQTIGISIQSILANSLNEKLYEELAQKNYLLASQKEALDSSAIVAETDLRGRITYLNDKFLEISKYSRDELMGKDHRILNSKFHSKEFFTNLWRTISKGEVWHGEVKNKTKDGNYYWVDTTIYPVKDANGKPKKYVAIRFDITDKKKALEDLQTATENAKKIAKLKADFLSSMSHEIRTPLNAIIGISDLLAETNLTPDQKKYVSVFQRAGNSLMQIINDVLDISKIEAGQIHLEEKSVDLKSLVEEVCDLIAPSAEKKGLAVKTFIDPNCPTKVMGDFFRIKQVIVNLVGNAVKFTEEGFVQIEIFPNNSTQKNGNILFCITDTGVGISKEQIGNLFHAFSQGDDSITKKYGGTGLGLAISKKFINMMSGEIWVESKIGEGSKFYFTLQLKEELSPQVPTLKHESNFVFTLPLNYKIKILLTEDSEDNRILIESYLKKLPIDVEIAENGKIALEKFKKENFDLILMDMQMPIMDGYETTRKIREWEASHNRERTMIVALTAFALHEEEQKTVMAGCDMHLSKPVKKQTLLDCIQSIAVSRPLKKIS